MRSRTWGAVFIGVLPFLGGCAGMNNTERDARTGALLGAGGGAVLGQAAGGHPLVGAILGAGAGTLLGGAVGNEEDKRERADLLQAKNEAEAKQGTPLGLTDIIQLAQKDVGDEVIINQIRTTHSTFQLSSEDLRFLKENKVSDRVVLEMQNRRPDAHPPDAPGYPRGPRYISGPPPPYYFYGPPPPPPGIGVGFVIR